MGASTKGKSPFFDKMRALEILRCEDASEECIFTHRMVRVYI